MKFVQSSLAKKLIIILIALLVFNVVYPGISYAEDIGGILFQPLYKLLLGIVIPIDMLIGSFINSINFGNHLGDMINYYTEKIIEEKINGTTSIVNDSDIKNYIKDENDRRNIKSNSKNQKSLGQLFIGPDSIFSRRIS